MSLYQCAYCGCAENTALGMQPNTPVEWFDWKGIEERRGMHLCSACMPRLYRGGTIHSEIDGWHGEFERVFLPMGLFKTNSVGNLEHIQTGEENYRKYRVYPKFLSPKIIDNIASYPNSKLAVRPTQKED